MKLSLAADLFAAKGISHDNVLCALSRRVGAANGITAAALVRELICDHTLADERRLRSVIEQVRREGHAVCADPANGYFMAANAKELDATCEFLYGRALTTMKQITAMKKIAMPDLRGQLGLPLQPTIQGESHE